MTRVKAQITPELLEWARLSAGLSPDEAAQKVSKTTTGERILAWENGKDKPTIPQLRKMAQAYRRPLSIFYLPERPKDFQPMHDFRRMPGEAENILSQVLRREIRAAYQRRELALELLEDLDEKPSVFTLSTTLNDEPEIVGLMIRDALKVSYEEQTLYKNRVNSFRYWQRKIEEFGVLVFQVPRIPKSEMLGFSIAEPVLPVIAVNMKGKRGRVFTAMHEFAHLMLRRSGLCDHDEDSFRPPEEQGVEVFCNAVAGAALVPSRDLLREPIVAAKGSGRNLWDEEEINTLAGRYGVSQEVFVRRLLTLKRITNEFYQQKRNEYLAIYKRLEEQEKENQKDQDIRRNMPRETITKLGSPFVSLVLNNYYRDHITLSDVSDYLGVRVRHVPKIEREVRAA